MLAMSGESMAVASQEMVEFTVFIQMTTSPGCVNDQKISQGVKRRRIIYTS